MKTMTRRMLGWIGAAALMIPLTANGATAVHDLVADFSLDSNPTSTGWQYSQSLGNGGGPVGAVTQNWNQPDFGPGQPGWLGATPGPHAGWAKRIDNGDDTPFYDDPIDSVLTHGPTSVLWKVPVNDPHRYASISGGIWQIRPLNRSGTWRLLKNSTVLTSGGISDAAGNSTTPIALSTGTGGESALRDIPYAPGDEFRLEVLNNDFAGVQFTVTTTDVGPDPDIATHPQGQLVAAGSTVTLTVSATGTAPFTYQWKFNGEDIPGATSASLVLSNITDDKGGAYSVVVSNSKGSKPSLPAAIVVDSVAPETPGVHDLTGDFTFMGNPTSRGWQYSEALSAGGGPVGALTSNFQPDIFGPGQPGYAGGKVGPFAGWLQRVNNGFESPSLDAPVGSVLTHGHTSVLWKAPPNDPFKFATITGVEWSAEKNGRGQGWKFWKNDNVLLAEGVFATGSSDAPNVFETAPNTENLAGIPYSPGDTFRLEILPTSGPGGSTQGPYGDFIGLNVVISTSNDGPDPAIKDHPLSQTVVEGTDTQLKVVPVGTAPFTYQWQYNGNDMTGETSDTLNLNDILLGQAGNYAVLVSNSKGSKLSVAAQVKVTPKPTQVPGRRYDLADDFSLTSNPTAKGWQYSNAYLEGALPGDPVGPVSQNWNQPDFGPNQPGWLGNISGAHAGWAKRVDNGNPTATYDDPPGSVITHGPTSILWRAPLDDPGGVADLSGGLWNIRHLNRPSNWRIYKNDTEILTSGVVNDNSGSSTTPLSLASGSGGSAALKSIPYAPGDSFRLEIGGVGTSDFVAVQFTIITRQEYDAKAQFSLEANPTPTGWQYSRALTEGGGVVGAVSQNWNQPDFGPNQPGWLGLTPPGAHAGWAKRVDNGSPTATFDDPVGTIMTHGATSLLWKAPNNLPAQSVADIRGGIWNLRKLNRSGTWRILKNDTDVLTDGPVNDNSGTSAAPFPFTAGTAGASALHDVPIAAGDTIRLEVLNNDFVGVEFTISTYTTGILDPEITTQPRNASVLEGGSASFSVVATGTAPLTYQWKRNGTDIPGATGSTLTIDGVDTGDAGDYTVVVRSAVGSATSVAAVLTVIPLPPGSSRQQDSGADGLLVLEAEHFNAKTEAQARAWTLVTDPPGFSGEGAMQALPNEGLNVQNDVANSPRMDFRVRFAKTGTHYIWVRGVGDSGGASANDSVHLGLDTVLFDTSRRISGFTDNAGYVWTKGRVDAAADGGAPTLNIPTAGEHVVNVWMREDGLIVDKIILTTNPNFTPADGGPAESPVAGEGGPTLTITRSGNNIRIAWDGGGTLESTQNLPGGWAAVNGAASPYDTAIQAGNLYFRVRK